MEGNAMATCIKCGKKGLLLKTDSSGLCAICAMKNRGDYAIRLVDSIYHRPDGRPLPNAHEIATNVINNYAESNFPLDQLAVSLAYINLGANSRKKAIEYMEKYMSNPNPQSYFSAWEIYSFLGALYEKEYDFEKAINCYKKLVEINSGRNCGDYKRVADVLSKIDINQCVKYWENVIIKSACYKTDKAWIDHFYEEALTKQKNNYVYRPRKKK